MYMERQPQFSKRWPFDQPLFWDGTDPQVGFLQIRRRINISEDRLHKGRVDIDTAFE